MWSQPGGQNGPGYRAETREQAMERAMGPSGEARDGFPEHRGLKDPRGRSRSGGWAGDWADQCGGRAGDEKPAWPPSWGLTLRVSGQRVPGKADLPDDIIPAGGWRGSPSWAGLVQNWIPAVWKKENTASFFV